MKSTLLKVITPLASLKYQRRYIVHGDRDEYVLIEELIDSAIGTITTVLKNTRFSQSLSQEQLESIKLLFEKLEENSEQIPINDTSVSTEEVVERSVGLSVIRDQAVQCLRVFDYDLSSWEAVAVQALH